MIYILLISLSLSFMTFFGVYHQRIDDWVADRARMVMNGNVQDGIMDEKRDGNLTIYEKCSRVPVRLYLTRVVIS